MDILWIIIFVIYMMYRALNETKKKQEEARRRMQRKSKTTLPGDFVPRGKTYTEIDDYEEELPWDFEPVEQYEQPQQVIIPDEIEETGVSNKYLEKLKKLDTIKKQAKLEDISQQRSKQMVVEDIDSPDTTPQKLVLNFDSDSIRTGFIMSEILQPPRAKRPIR